MLASCKQNGLKVQAKHVACDVLAQRSLNKQFCIYCVHECLLVCCSKIAELIFWVFFTLREVFITVYHNSVTTVNFATFHGRTFIFACSHILSVLSKAISVTENTESMRVVMKTQL